MLKGSKEAGSKGECWSNSHTSGQSSKQYLLSRSSLEAEGEVLAVFSNGDIVNAGNGTVLQSRHISNERPSSHVVDMAMIFCKRR